MDLNQGSLPYQESSNAPDLHRLVVELLLPVRQRPPSSAGGCRDRHSVGHSGTPATRLALALIPHSRRFITRRASCVLARHRLRAVQTV